MSTDTEQPCQRYSGITRHAGKWLVKLRYRGHDLTIGHYANPEDAAWAADFTRYLLLGLRPGAWHPNIARPNFPPSDRWSVNRYLIRWRLLWSGVVPPEVLTRHWEEYEAAARGNTPAQGRL